jgi:hypothetical protein
MKLLDIIKEEADNNLTDKGRKKANLIYKTFKTGKYQVGDLKYRYELPDEYWISNDDEWGTPVVILTMNPQQQLNLYVTITDLNGDNHERFVERRYPSIYSNAKDIIKKKFRYSNVDIIF